MFEELNQAAAKEKSAKPEKKNFALFSSQPLVLNLPVGINRISAPLKLPTLPEAISNFEQRIDFLRAKGKKRGKIFFILVVVFILIIGLAVIFTNYSFLNQIDYFSKKTEEFSASLVSPRDEKSKINFFSEEWRQCAKDDDCRETKEDCCTCETGGKKTAINRQFLVGWEEYLAEKCQGTICNGADMCMTEKLSCQDGKCVFIVLPQTSTTTVEMYASSSDAKTGEELNADSDQDELTDEQENKYGTDPQNPDTDKDGFTDGEEVYKGYNPLGEGKL